MRSSALAEPPPSGGGTAGLTLAFTKTGATKFHALTRAPALRGARLRRAQVTAIAINGHVYGRPAIDYKVFPNGLSGREGIEVTGMTFTVAKRLAKLIRSA